MTETVLSFLFQTDRLKRFSPHKYHLYSYIHFEVFMDIVIAVLAYVKYLYKKVRLYICRILIIKQITLFSQFDKKSILNTKKKKKIPKVRIDFKK